jgi:putative phosphoribosyl transferase
MAFRDRSDAGRKLGEELERFAEEDVIVLGMPRGGVEVAFEVARSLEAPLDVVVIRKLGAPANPEFGFGAIGPNGLRILDDQSVRMLGLSEEDIERVAEREREELERRLEEYRGERTMPDMEGKTLIVVDDGAATGGSARAAVRALKEMDPGKLILALAVAPPDTAEELRQEVDELICLETPSAFMAVGQWYSNFSQTTDEQVVELLKRAKEERQ